MATARNPLVDLLRFVAIFFVIILHIDLHDFGTPAALARMASRWAIPYFFIISGYFAAGHDLSVLAQNRRRALKHLLGLVLIGDLLYAPYFWKTGAQSGGMDVLVLLTQGTAVHLWFLHSLFFGQLIISFARSNRSAISLAFFLGMLVQLVPLYSNELSMNGVVRCLLDLGQSIPFLALGFLLQSISLSRWISLVFVLAGVAAQAIDFYLETQRGQLGAYDIKLFCGTGALAFASPRSRFPLRTPGNQALKHHQMNPQALF